MINDKILLHIPIYIYIYTKYYYIYVQVCLQIIFYNYFFILLSSSCSHFKHKHINSQYKEMQLTKQFDNSVTFRKDSRKNLLLNS